MLLHGNAQHRSEITLLLHAKQHYQVIEMAEGQEALQALRSGIQPEVILLDMSSVQGADRLIVELKQVAAHIPVIVLVKYGQYQEAAESLLLGAYDFITQPFAQERISVTLRNAIALQRAKREAALALTMANQARALELNGNLSGALEGDTLISLISSNGEARKIDDIERAAIRFAMRFYKGRISEVARKLGIGRSTLYRKLDAIGKI
jgi:DNA-binding NtrC family response regulator